MHAQAAQSVHPVRPIHQSAAPLPGTSVTGALRAVEAFLLRGGQQTARRNAWAAVVEDRRRAKDRSEVQHLMDSMAGSAVTRNAGPESL